MYIVYIVWIKMHSHRFPFTSGYLFSIEILNSRSLEPFSISPEGSSYWETM